MPENSSGYVISEKVLPEETIEFDLLNWKTILWNFNNMVNADGKLYEIKEDLSFGLIIRHYPTREHLPIDVQYKMNFITDTKYAVLKMQSLQTQINNIYNNLSGKIDTIHIIQNQVGLLHSNITNDEKNTNKS